MKCALLHPCAAVSYGSIGQYIDLSVLWDSFTGPVAVIWFASVPVQLPCVIRVKLQQKRTMHELYTKFSRYAAFKKTVFSSCNPFISCKLYNLLHLCKMYCIVFSSAMTNYVLCNFTLLNNLPLSLQNFSLGMFNTKNNMCQCFIINRPVGSNIYWCFKRF